MPLNVAVQMDPIERINITGDSTFALLLEAQARGHRCITTRRIGSRCATGPSPRRCRRCACRT